jgi:hypothetical protein
MCSASTSQSLCEVSFDWVQYKKTHDGSKLVQVMELDKLACQPFLTNCCVGAMKSRAIALQAFVQHLVL